MNKESFGELYANEKTLIICETNALVEEFLRLAIGFEYNYNEKKISTIKDSSRMYLYTKDSNGFSEVNIGIYLWVNNGGNVVYFKSSKEFKVSEDEKAILRNISSEFRFIVRNMSGNIFLFEFSPHKNYNYNVWHRHDSPFGSGKIVDFSVYKHLFQYVKWEDEEPKRIEDLLKM